MMRPQLQHFLGELYRVRWPLVIAVVVIGLRTTGRLSPASESAVLLYKLSLLCVGWILGMIVVQQSHPYIDLGTWVDRAAKAKTEAERRTAAIVLAGLAGMRGLVLAAFVLGLSLAL